MQMKRYWLVAVILAVTFASFWVYGRIAHREPAYGPLSLRAHAFEYRNDRATAPAAVAPDMNSDAVRHANADVLAELQRSEQQPEPNKAKHAGVPHRKKKAAAIARRTPGWAMQAYAWGPRTYQVPFGRY